VVPPPLAARCRREGTLHGRGLRNRRGSSDRERIPIAERKPPSRPLDSHRDEMEQFAVQALEGIEASLQPAPLFGQAADIAECRPDLQIFAAALRQRQPLSGCKQVGCQRQEALVRACSDQIAQIRLNRPLINGLPDRRSFQQSSRKDPTSSASLRRWRLSLAPTPEGDAEALIASSVRRSSVACIEGA